ncbi:hypothetical protein ANN_01904 [Periplaneta americana]|uniref:Uncharacterized protein n=1 Tax=Periplaneta americana TaxID=6978 RepID=A0ABQ8TUU4_PERAM|nr:hypothetical protein ANN_01904 [Periplaneta americana]
MGRDVARMGESRNAYSVFVGRPEGKRPLGRPRHRWEDNIKMDLREVEYDDREWINLAQDRDQCRAYVRAGSLKVSGHAISGHFPVTWPAKWPEDYSLSDYLKDSVFLSKPTTIDAIFFAFLHQTITQENVVHKDFALMNDSRVPMEDEGNCRPFLYYKCYRIEKESNHGFRLNAAKRKRLWWEERLLKRDDRYEGIEEFKISKRKRSECKFLFLSSLSQPIAFRDGNCKARCENNSDLGNLRVIKVGTENHLHPPKIRGTSKGDSGITYEGQQKRLNEMVIMEGDNAGEMSPASSTKSYPTFAHIGFRKKPGKTSTRTWTLTLREEHRLRMFENKVLRKIFGAKRDEVTGEWRKLHNTELHALYSSPDIIRNIKSRHLRWAGHVARMGESRNAYRVLVGRRPEGKRPLGRPRRRWEDNIKMDSREVGYDDRDWINLAQDRDQWWAYVRAAMNLRVP